MSTSTTIATVPAEPTTEAVASGRVRNRRHRAGGSRPGVVIPAIATVTALAGAAGYMLGSGS